MVVRPKIAEFCCVVTVLINKALKYQIRKSELTASGVKNTCIEEGIEES